MLGILPLCSVHTADVNIETRILEHIVKGCPIYISNEIPNEIAMKEMFTWKQVSMEELTKSRE